MAEYIEKEKASLILREEAAAHYPTAFHVGLYAAARAFESIPAADVRPVVRGFNKLKDYPSLFECSVCGWECDDTMPGDTTTYNFCPNCGADMRPTSMSGAKEES